MTCRKAFGVLATATIVATLVYGCSNGDGGRGVPTDAGADGSTTSDASAHDASPGDSAITSCVPADVSTFQPPTYVPASGASQGKCTPAQITTFYDDCLAPNSTQTTCAPFNGATATPENKACYVCIITRDTDTKYGPVVEHKGVVSVNIPGCMELRDGSAGLVCAKAYQAADGCSRAACAANCPVIDDASFQLYLACVQQASANGCKSYQQGAACAASKSDSGTTGAGICFRGQSFHDLYDSVVPIFCGGGPGDAGGGG